MKKREYSTSISAAMDDLKEFSKSKIEEFKVEGEKLLAQIIKELEESAAGDSTEKPTSNKAECMQTDGQAEVQRGPQSEPQLVEDVSDISLMNWLVPLDYVGAGSEMDAVDALNCDFEIYSKAEEERHKLISSDNEGENEEVEDTELEGLSTLDGPRKSRRTVKEPA
ncbi:uncharacterized protein LOC141665581 [Apium graveolens]|uniref:uncharacterized protein LOC141665581 n=1 Tax=Apium graveolens TaxID=4045 RepID=UPI003D79239D